MAITSAGLGSGLDIEGLITKLMTVEAQPLKLLAKREASYQAKLTAFGAFSGAVSSFKSAASALNSTSGINAVTATSSDTATLTASGTSIAVAGSYSVNVTQLAKAQQLVAAGQTSTTASIGTGTITFDFGTISGGAFNPVTGQYTGATFTSNGGGTANVTISAANDSLAGIRDAINAANIGVTATIINDGSGTPYRLALSSKNQGAANSIKVSVSGSAGLTNFISNDPAATQNLSETVSAQDALLQINGVNVSSTSNKVTSAIPGVTLNLLKTTTGTPTTVTVGRDSANFTKLVDSFVKNYNDLNKTIKDLTSYDPKTKAAGLLIGDSAVRAIQTQIRSVISSNVPGVVSGAYTNANQVGITFQKDGTLAVDSTKLAAALSSNPNDVAALFASLGRATDPLVSYVSSTSTTQVANKALNISNIASQGVATGVAPPAGLTITAAVNDGLNITVDGVTTSVTIAAGVYATQAALNAAIQSAINGDAGIVAAGSSVAVTTGGGGEIVVTSGKYGASSVVNINAGSGASYLFGAPAVVGVGGTDVAGTIGGQSATGAGQELTSIDGLKIRISGGALGARGNIEFSRGLGHLLDKLADSYVSSTGSIKGKTDSLDKQIESINDQRTAFNLRLVAIEKRYRAQFTALDSTLSSLNQTSSFLSQQFDALSAAIGGGKKK